MIKVLSDWLQAYKSEFVGNNNNYIQQQRQDIKMVCTAHRSIYASHVFVQKFYRRFILMCAFMYMCSRTHTYLHNQNNQCIRVSLSFRRKGKILRIQVQPPLRLVSSYLCDVCRHVYLFISTSTTVAAVVDVVVVAASISPNNQPNKLTPTVLAARANINKNGNTSQTTRKNKKI